MHVVSKYIKNQSTIIFPVEGDNILILTYLASFILNRSMNQKIIMSYISRYFHLLVINQIKF